ncbi:MAG TPA: HipA domain-containing protein [Acholeplasmataceae bacterium]|jgi:serine/threonine-protein kinase HipA|nr:type II toxin-antitoxin system HipA family toxin [Acholeplasmataceae bacterium]HPX71856.1 HipA domain-containing protein [Acholeplasmataceae bacterium]HQC30747.1 HipA domain-containing protein [Acholeplasmataceae bacterium]
MTRTLNVYLNKKKVGILTETNGKVYSFSYVLNNSNIISLSMKDLSQKYDDKIVRPFLENLLPESKIIEYISKVYLVSQNNPFSLLSKIGEDCAGAISLTNDNLNDDNFPLKLSKEKFLSILEKNEKGASYYQKGMRLSLAGTQNKLSLLIKDDEYYLPNFDYPSNVILKLNNTDFTSLLLNEYFSTKLADALKLPVSNLELIKKPYPHLIIERYDRINNIRIHQEDFCQILGVRPNNKYQKEGGPSFEQIAETIKTNLNNPTLDLINLARILLFNYLIGNCDYHAKNLSVLYTDTLKLSPFYDLLSTYIYDDLSKEMAMSINNKYNIDDITKKDIIKEYDNWGLNGKQMFSLLISEFKDIVPLSERLLKNINSSNFDLLKLTNFIKIQYSKLI